MRVLGRLEAEAKAEGVSVTVPLGQERLNEINAVYQRALEDGVLPRRYLGAAGLFVWGDLLAEVDRLRAALDTAEKERDAAWKEAERFRGLYTMEMRRANRALNQREQAVRDLARLQESCAHLVLTWRCTTCGWETTMPVPGFGGDGCDHFPDGRTPCGPLIARRSLREAGS